MEISRIKLRDYQSATLSKLYIALNRYNRILVQMPTGTGKTTVFSKVVSDAINSGQKVLLVAHRKELIQQMSARLMLFDVTHGIIISGITPNPKAPVQIASVQTLRKRELPDADLLIIDEAHHATAGNYRYLFAEYKRVIGFTATPYRLDGTGFEDLFEDIIQSKQLKEFVKEGYEQVIAPYKELGYEINFEEI